jgi:mono/diheme cytochrome c family protein
VWAALVLGLPAGHGVAAADGAALFAQHCAACHQADGSGTVGLAPSLKGEHWAKLGGDRGYLPTVLLKGLSGPIKVSGQIFVGSMPAFAEQLDDATLAALASHVRRLQGATDDKPFAADEIKALRQQPGSPPQSRQRRGQVLGS